MRKTRAVLSSGLRSGVVSIVRGGELVKLGKVARNWNASSQEKVAREKRDACISGEGGMDETFEESLEEREENREGRGAKISTRKMKVETAKSDALIFRLNLSDGLGAEVLS